MTARTTLITRIFLPAGTCEDDVEVRLLLRLGAVARGGSCPGAQRLRRRGGGHSPLLLELVLQLDELARTVIPPSCSTTLSVSVLAITTPPVTLLTPET